MTVIRERWGVHAGAWEESPTVTSVNHILKNYH